MNEPPPALRLLLADNAPTRTGMRLALAEELSICGEVASALEAITSAEVLRPDACFLGSQLLGEDIEPLRAICRAAPECAVVVFAPDEAPGRMVEVLRAGAIGYVPGALTPQRLRTIVHAVTERQAIVPRALTRELVLAIRDEGPDHRRLTDRESEVLRMVRRGVSTREIATRLRIAPVTVRRHVSALVRKLEASDRAALIDPIAPGEGGPPPVPGPG